MYDMLKECLTGGGMHGMILFIRTLRTMIHVSVLGLIILFREARKDGDKINMYHREKAAV